MKPNYDVTPEQIKAVFPAAAEIRFRNEEKRAGGLPRRIVISPRWNSFDISLDELNALSELLGTREITLEYEQNWECAPDIIDIWCVFPKRYTSLPRKDKP